MDEGSPNASSALWDQLAIFSERLAKRMGLSGAKSLHGAPRFDAAPTGTILHYTADGDFQNVVRWFLNPESKSSAHFVVGTGRYPWALGLDGDLPLVAALPVTVMLQRPVNSVAWHATWSNAWAYGIELINTGELRYHGSQLCWWPKDYQQPYRGRQKPWGLFGRLWEPFSPAQIAAACILCRALVQGSQGALLPSHVLGHENVQGVSTPGGGGHDKRDLGPCISLDLIRQVAFSSADMSLDAIAKWSEGDHRPMQWRLAQAQQVMGQKVADIMPSTVARRGLVTPKDPVLSKLLLRLLGYHVEDLTRPELSAADVRSLKVFQRLMALTPDGALGPKSCEALCDRYVDRFAPRSPQSVVAQA